MKANRKVIVRAVLAALYFIIGASIGICGEFAIVDPYWSGMGAALIVIGAVQMIRIVRYNTNAQYKEETDTAVNDERNRFLAMKAWSWAGYLYVFLAAVGSVVFKLIHQEMLMFAASGSVCIILVFYWISYLILRKKY